MEMNENQFTSFKEYETFKPDFHKIYYAIDNVVRGCHQKYFHTFQ